MTGTAASAESENVATCHILSLDGGGAKGFYTLGVLREVEAMLGCRLSDHFDLVFGTSTGAIIASLVALGFSVDDIHSLYREYVPRVMKPRTRGRKTVALAESANAIFGDRAFEDVKTGIGVVATKWIIERPMIFKGDASQAHGRKATFVPGFGVSIADAVQASCSAYPFFERKTVTTSAGDSIELIDGGYCANNPSLYAIADAIHAQRRPPHTVRVLSVGVGVYPEPKRKLWMRLAKRYLISLRLLQKTLEINTQSMEQLRAVLFKEIRTVRVNDTFEQPEMATDFMEHDLRKLNILRQRGGESFAARELDIRGCLMNDTAPGSNPE